MLATQHILALHSRSARGSWEKGKQHCAVKNTVITQRPKPPFSAASQNLGNFSAKPFPSYLEGVTSASAPEHGRAEDLHRDISWNKLKGKALGKD